jgi:hypothetical protein
VRLSPKSIFFGIVALGLPFAVTVGWTLGTPGVAPPVASAPGGAGGMGAAPVHTVPSQPVTAVEYSSKPPRPGFSPSAAAASAAPASVPPPASTEPTTGTPASQPPLPALTLPPVPTPTEVSAPPPSPSATPSGSASAPNRRFGGARLVRRQ